MQVGHVAAVFPTVDAAHRRRRLGDFIPSQRNQHAADQVDHQIARYAGAVVSPAAPAREVQFIERNFRGIIEPRIPVQGLRGKIRRRRIFPRAGWIISSQCQFHHLDIADRAALVEFICLGAQL